MKILIAGGGDLAENIIRLMEPKKHEIIVIEKDEARKQELESNYDILVIKREATDVDVYTREVNMGEIDAVLALTKSDEINVLILAIAKLQGVPIKVGRFTEEKISELVREMQLGIPIIQPRLLASIFASYMLSARSPLCLGKINNLNLYLIGIFEGDRAAGMKVSEIGMNEEAGRIIMILDEVGFRVPREEEILKPGDIIFVLAPSNDFIKFIKG
ncbi:MAG: NAD-binding protein [Candidatus Bathyarchaeia archaeon]